jgi:hypothetical protein
MTATASSSTPRTIFSQSTQVAGSPDWLAPDEPAAKSTIAPTTPSPISHPPGNASPLALALAVVSMITTAMIGSGLTATPTAIGKDCPTAPP